MGDQHVDHRDLGRVRIKTADGALAHDRTTIIGHRLHHPFEFVASRRDDAQRDALGEVGHDRIGNRALELGIDVARRQRLGAGGEIEIDRRELRKAHAERAENDVGMLYHAARARADRDATRRAGRKTIGSAIPPAR